MSPERSPKEKLSLSHINAAESEREQTSLEAEYEQMNNSVDLMNLTDFTQENFPTIWDEAPDFFVGKMAVVVNAIINNCNSYSESPLLKKTMDERKKAAEFYFVVTTSCIFGGELTDKEVYKYQGLFEPVIDTQSQLQRIEMALKFGVPSLLDNKRLSVLYDEMSESDIEYLKLLARQSQKMGLEEVKAEVEDDQSWGGYLKTDNIEEDSKDMQIVNKLLQEIKKNK